MHIFLIHCSDLGTRIVVVQDLLIVVALLAHHGSTYLAQAYAMAPAGSCEHEMLRNAFGVDVEAVDYEG